MTPYDKLIARKRKWTPVQVEAGKLLKVRKRLSTVPSLCAIWNSLLVTSSLKPWKRRFQKQHVHFYLVTLMMNTTTTELWDSQYERSVQIRNLKRKQNACDKLGSITQTTPYARQWFWREAYSLLSSHSSVRLVTLD